MSTLNASLSSVWRIAGNNSLSSDQNGSLRSSIYPVSIFNHCLCPIKYSAKFSSPGTNLMNGKTLSKKYRINCSNGETQTEKKSMKIAVAGATGFVGQKLIEKLLSEGHSVSVLSRSASKARSVFPSRINGRLKIFEMNELEKGIEGCNGVINLSGAPISTRWNEEIKKEIIESRVSTTKAIVNEIKKLPKGKRPSVLINSSAIGFYGPSENLTFDEGSSAGSDFLSKVCKEWESSAKEIETEDDVRLVIIRTGIVLDKEGGALAKMAPIFQLFAGGPLGSGKQWFSWIHREDLVNLMIECLNNSNFKGTINGTAPKPVRLGEMCDQLGRVLGRPSWLPVPEFAVKTLLGEGACVVLDGQKVIPKRAKELGFVFEFEKIQDALSRIYT